MKSHQLLNGFIFFFSFHILIQTFEQTILSRVIISQIKHNMNNIFRTLIAGYGAKKLGGGCLSTILIFILLYYALGHC